MATMENVLAEILALRSEVKNITKIIRKIRSVQDDPTGEKATERSKNNGFNREVEVDDALRTFLGLEPGEKIARSQVTRRINAYVKENGLKHPDNGRIIVLDEKLKALLNPPDGVDVTFLNLQKYIGPHYVKNTESSPPVAPAPTPTPTTTKKVVKRPVVRKPATVA